MASSNRNDGTGLGNYELRFTNAGQTLGEARRRNRLHNWPIIVEGPRDKRALESLEFVGPICETTCKFVKYNKYQKLNQSDYVAISDVGAYGASLSSNYNTKPLIAEIIINKSKARIIRKKQNIKSLLKQ